MSVSRSLSIKFGTEGFSQAVSEMQRTAKSFDTALAAAQKAVNEANLNLLRGMVMNSSKRMDEAESARSKAAREANQIIGNSYRELRIKSESDLNNLRNQAISAYNAIRNSGVSSARDIDRANLALKERLGQIDDQLQKSAGNAKNWGQNLTQSALVASWALKEADARLEPKQVAKPLAQKTVKATNVLPGNSLQTLDGVLSREKYIAQKEKELKNFQKGLTDRALDGASTGLSALSQARNFKTGLIEATANGKTLGFLNYRETSRQIDIKSMGTNQAIRGAGTELVNELKRIAAELGKAITVEAPAENAMPFYKKQGFKYIDPSNPGAGLIIGAEQIKQEIVAADKSNVNAKAKLQSSIQLAQKEEIAANEALAASFKKLELAKEKYIKLDSEWQKRENKLLAEENYRFDEFVIDDDRYTEAKRKRIEGEKRLGRTAESITPTEAEADQSLLQLQQMRGYENVVYNQSVESNLRAIEATKKLDELGQQYSPKLDKAQAEVLAAQKDFEAETLATQERISKARDKEKAARNEYANFENQLAQEAIDRESSKSQKIQAIQAKEHATWRRERYTEQAFGALGIQSEASITRQKQQLTDAYNAIRISGVASARDIKAAERALQSQTQELNNTIRGGENAWAKLNQTATGALKGIAGGFAQAAGFTIVYGTVNAIGSAIQKALAFPFEAAKDYANFETQLKAIKVAADGANIGPLKKEIESLAPKIGKMPQDLATLSVELTRAGYTADQASKLLRGIGLSSQATGEDLSIVGKITRTTISQFQVAQQDYANVSDVLVAGANASEAGIGSLGEALSYVGTRAYQSKQSLQDTVTLLAVLSKSGLDGSSAGTNLAEALDRIKSASAGASDEVVITTRGMKTSVQAIEELGVQFRNADGTLRPLLDVLPELRQALKKLPQEDQDVIMKVLFGAQGGRAVSSLLSKTDAQIKEIRDRIIESGGAAKKAGKEMLSGFGGALEKLNATAEVGKLKLGEAIAPGLEAAVDVLGILLGRMSTANGLFDEANSASKEFANYFKGNPALVDELDRQLQELVRTTLRQASENAKQLLQYLKDNPHAIADAVTSLKDFIDGLGAALKLAQQIGQALSFKFDPVGDALKTLSKIQQGRETAKRAGFSESEFDNRFKSLENKIPWWNIAERMQRRNELIEQAISSFGGNSGGNFVESGKKIYPVVGGQYVGGGGSFGASRSYGAHTGEDITGSLGTPVYAAIDGLVSSIKTLDKAANSFNVAVQSADGTIARYKHITPTVAPTQRVLAGQQIGTVARQDALSTGPHLHFEVEQGGKFVDPKAWLKDSSQLSKAVAAEIKTQVSTGNTSVPRKTSEPAKPKPIIRVTKTGVKNAQGLEKGLEILQMDLVENGSVKDSILVTSGRASNQTFTTAANSAKGRGTAPIPEGEYKVDKLEQGNFGPSIGSTWVGLENLTPNQRSGFGIHFDNDFAIKPGSEGCLVLGDKTSIAKLQSWMKNSDPSKLVVDYGFGTVTDPTKLTKPEISKTLDQERKAAAAQRNQYQYLARIAAGESSGGKNIGPNPQTGAYGEYQFTPESRKLLMDQGGPDPWSKSKGTRDKAALKWIELYGQEIGVDILSMIRKGEFEAVDKLLGQKGPSGFAQFSSLPGGTEASSIWRNPANLRKFAPIGEVQGDTYYRQAEDARAAAEKEAREIVEKARRRANEQLKQQQDLTKKRLEESQKQQLLEFDLATSKMPEGEAKLARGSERSALERTQQLTRDQLEVEQTINQLLEERKQKLADIDALKKSPDSKIEVTNRDITAEIKALEDRKKALEDNFKVENQIQQNNTTSELANRTQVLDQQVADINQTLSDLKLQYADTSAETREAQALAQVNQEFDQHKQVIVEAIKATLDLIAAKQAQGFATDAEINTLERLKGKYLELQDIQNKQIGKSQVEFGLDEQQRKLDQDKAIGDINSQLADAKATRLEKFGLPDQANQMREQAAITQEMIRYKQQLIDLQSTYKDDPQILNELIQKANELNSLNLNNIRDQFKSIGETIQDSAQSALAGFFTDFFQGTKSVEDAFRDMAIGILKTIASMAAQILATNIVRGIGSLFGNAIGGGGGGFGSLLGFASGGLVSGPGNGTSDSVLARVSRGEFIMNAGAVDTWGTDFLYALNARQMPASILDIGAVNNSRSGGRQATVVNQTINVSTPDANSFNRTAYQRDQDSAESLRRTLSR